ncbi:glycosyltransferase [Subsaxibacter sp. CAU 1640]|uniref:glycosyltransferase family 2 protein n=1 Tax=Subsaxibacter sp. CAU 1640 TaxID=2933271 RepID=UPI002002CFEF|nr:glycosyltransferase [Subsaxibacter sp. CAU 1640]MCK7591027.1 glycosyltransferase [Subsaxibacter sp. CAU 1640]
MNYSASIIVPVYNAEKYLDRCINSLLNQSYENLEIILVNDGSTDNSGTICDRYHNSYKNIRVIHHEKSSGSASRARNSGLFIASGDYISFVDSDDWIHPEMISIMCSYIEKYEAGLSECELLETADYIIKSLPENIDNHCIFEDRLETLKRIIDTQRFSVCVRVYKASILKGIKFPEGVISEDLYFTLDVSERINSIVKIDLPLYYYHLTPNSITRKDYNLKHLDTLKSSLYLINTISEKETDSELQLKARSFVVNELVYHYKMLNYFPSLDKKFEHRKRLKKQIRENLKSEISYNLYTKLANALPVKTFEMIISLNKFKHRVMRTNHFS